MANGIAVLLGSAVFGTYFFLSLLLQNVDGYSPLRTGLAFLPVGLGTLIGASTASRLVRILGARNQLTLGLGLAAAGLLWLSRVGPDDGYLGHILGPMILIGVGVGMSFVPMTLSATAGVPDHEAGLAAGLINTTRQVGGALGLAIMATVASNIAARHGLGQHSSDSALTSGYRAAFAIAGYGAILAALLATLLPKRPASTQLDPPILVATSRSVRCSPSVPLVRAG